MPLAVMLAALGLPHAVRASPAAAMPAAHNVVTYVFMPYSPLRGQRVYLTFSGQTEHPIPREVIFADQAEQVHARRWANRQSGMAAVQASTATALIVAEAMHDTAPADVPELIAALAGELSAIWSITPAATVLSQSSPRFTFPT